MNTTTKAPPVSVTDIEVTAGATCEQADAMETMFRAIARLTDDKEIQGLCAHGAMMAAIQGNDIDSLRERAISSGLAGGAA